MRHALLLPLLLAACGPSGSPPMPDASGPVTWCADTRAVFTTRCTGCHATTRTGAARNGATEGVNFDTYEAASASAQSAREMVLSGVMPPTGRLPDAEAWIIAWWADQGAPEGSCTP